MKTTSIIITLLFLSTCIFAQSESGKASFYADKFQGNKTANGERFDQKKLTAAHRTLPFNTYVKVTSLNNKRSVIVRINDRGPFVKGVVIDLSKAAAQRLDMVNAGVVNVILEIVDGPKKTPVIKAEKPSKPTTTVTLSEKPQKKPPTIAMGSSKPRLGKSTNLFSVEVKELARENYGIQVGSYAQYQNILKQINSLQKKIQKGCMVFVGKSSEGGALYKLIIGPFPSKTAAENQLAIFKRQSINGFVVDLSTIK